MCPPKRPRATRLGQGSRIPLIRLHSSHPVRVHRRVRRVGDDRLVTELLQIPRHPFALGRRLEQDPHPISPAEILRQVLAARRDPHLPRNPPSSSSSHTWLFTLCRWGPTVFMAGLHSFAPLSASNDCGASATTWSGGQPLHPSYFRGSEAAPATDRCVLDQAFFCRRLYRIESRNAKMMKAAPMSPVTTSGTWMIVFRNMITPSAMIA